MKKKQMTPIEQVRAYVARFEIAIQSIGQVPSAFGTYEMPEKKSETGKALEERGAYIHFKNLVNSFQKGDKRKCEHHLARVKKCMVYHANEHPFQVGQSVEVIRYEHGYEPGYTARITKVYNFGPRGSKYAYDARVIETRDGPLSPENQFDIEIAHTRDAYRH